MLRATHGLLSLQRRPAPLPQEAPAPSAAEVAEVGLGRGCAAGPWLGSGAAAPGSDLSRGVLGRPPSCACRMLCMYAHVCRLSFGRIRG